MLLHLQGDHCVIAEELFAVASTPRQRNNTITGTESSHDLHTTTNTNTAGYCEHTFSTYIINTRNQ